MNSRDRVAFIACLWFVGWTTTGIELGKLIGMPGTGAVWGFIFALVTVFAWPWVLPDFLDRWIYEGPHDDPHPLTAHLSGSRWRVMSDTMLHSDELMRTSRPNHRVAIVGALWFAFWMILSGALGGWFSTSGQRLDGIYFGFFNGAWWALLTSFAWPWIMPASIDRWMYR